MDKLYINSLTLQTTIGCLAWEKQILQSVIISLEIGLDCKKIALTDKIETTVNYALLAEQLSAFAIDERNELIETLAEKLAKFIHQNHPTISQLKLSLEKPGAIPGAKSVGVIIERKYI